MAINFVFFILCAGLVALSGIRLTFHGDRIAELSGFGKGRCNRAYSTGSMRARSF